MESRVVGGRFKRTAFSPFLFFCDHQFEDRVRRPCPVGMVNPWVQFGKDARRARPKLGLVGLADAEAMDAREFAYQVSLLDPPIFTGEHPDVVRETGVKRLRQFLQLRFDQRRCLGCQKELAAAIVR